jgi:dihydroflavonol-4-reductase
MPFQEDSPPGPHRSEYARSKHEGDRRAVELHKNHGLPLVMVFLAAVFGRGDPKSVMQIRKFVDGGVPVMIRSPNRFTYVDIGDAATAIVGAAQKDGNIGEKYLVGGERYTTEEYFRIISRAGGVPMPKVYLGRTPAHQRFDCGCSRGEAQGPVPLVPPAGTARTGRSRGQPRQRKLRSRTRTQSESAMAVSGP